MKFLTIAFVLCAILVAVASANGKRAQTNALRSEEEKEPTILELLKQGLGHFVVNTFSSIKEALSGSQNWRDMIYINGTNPYTNDDYDDDNEDGIYSGEKGEVLTLLYILVKKMGMLMDSRNSRNTDDEGDDDDDYYGWFFGGKDGDGEDDDYYNEDDYNLSDYFSGDSDYYDGYDSDYEDGYGYIDGDGEGDDSSYWSSSLFGNSDGDDDYNYNEEDYEEDYDKEEQEAGKEDKVEGAENETNPIKTESNGTTDDKTQTKLKKTEVPIKKELDNTIKDIKPDVVKGASKRN